MVDGELCLLAVTSPDSETSATPAAEPFAAENSFTELATKAEALTVSLKVSLICPAVISSANLYSVGFKASGV